MRLEREGEHGSPFARGCAEYFACYQTTRVERMRNSTWGSGRGAPPDGRGSQTFARLVVEQCLLALAAVAAMRVTNVRLLASRAGGEPRASRTPGEAFDVDRQVVHIDCGSWVPGWQLCEQP